MTNNELNYSEIPVCPETMQNMPESSSPWFANAANDAARADTVGEMLVLVRTMAAVILTPRQKDIFHLCYQEERTQVEIAEILGISQATVSHHLIGKMKRGKTMGGAMQKIRKNIRKAAVQGGGTDDRHRQLISALNDMLDESATRRSVSSCLNGLQPVAVPGRIHQTMPEISPVRRASPESHHSGSGHPTTACRGT